MQKISVHVLDGQNIGNESEAIRQVLEYFGAEVQRTLLGRPNDLIKALDQNRADYLVLCVHGEDGKMQLPELAANLYLPGEPSSSIGERDLFALDTIKCKLLVTSGCGLYTEDWAKFWLEKGVGHFIGAQKEVEGNTALQFILRLFYEIIQNKQGVGEAFMVAKTG